MAVDLHLHSLASDGSETPTAVVEAGVAAGLRTIALTDHDNLDGITEAVGAAERLGIELIPGAELSVEWDTGAMHMLVYFLEPGAGPLQDRLHALQVSRSTRNERMVEALNDLGFEISYDDVVTEAGGSGVGRPHIAQVLVDRGHADSINDAFDRLLAKGRPAYRGRDRLDAVEAISLARASGAVPVVAHPHTIGVNAEDYGSAFERLADAGLGGIEAHYAEYDPDMRTHLARLAHTLGLAATGGSDYHGRYKPGISVGTGRGDLTVPSTAVDELRSQRERSDAV